MEHLLHPFIPGTPENQALLAMAPALAPLWDQLWIILLGARLRLKKEKHDPTR